MRRKGALRSTATVRSNNSASVFSIFPRVIAAAFIPRPSIRQKGPIVSAMSLAGTCGSSRAPMQKKDAASPSSAANACAASFRLPWIMTFAPSRAKTLTMPSPIPVVEPVTRITLFFRRILALGGSWLENSFDDYAGMHLLKRFVPLVERGDAIEYRTEIDLATRQQGNDFLPDGPVV